MAPPGTTSPFTVPEGSKLDQGEQEQRQKERHRSRTHVGRSGAVRSASYPGREHNAGATAAAAAAAEAETTFASMSVSSTAKGNARSARAASSTTAPAKGGPSSSPDLGDVLQGTDDFDLFDGELLRDSDDDGDDDRQPSNLRSDTF